MDGSSIYPPQQPEPNSTDIDDDAEWAERSAYWQEQAAWTPRHPHQKRRHRNPLVLGGHGVRLRIDRGSLFVQNGFTHYPQRREEWRFFPGHPDLPSRIVVVDGNGSLTFDVLAWLSAQGIPLVQVNWRGEALVVAGGHGYAANPKLVQAQRAAQANNKRRMEICRSLIAEKITRSIGTLTECIDPSPARERGLAELTASASEIERRPPRTMDALRGIEGRVAQAYFTAWRSMPLRWKGLGRKPIPEECSQLARSETPAGARFERKGTPDAGVECYSVFANSDEWGWQAKYFDTLGDSQWDQLDSSVRTALSKHPKLVQYFLCTPIDRPDARMEGRKSAKERWDDHVAKWKGWATDAGMSVEFVYWGSHELLERLSRPEHAGRVRFWFDVRGLDAAWFAERLDEALRTAGPRYTPQVHIDLPIAAELNAFGRTDTFFDEVKAGAREIRKQLRHLEYSNRDVTSEGLQTSVAELVARLRALLSRFEVITPNPIGPVPFKTIAEEITAATRLSDELQNVVHDQQREEASRRVGAKGYEYAKDPLRDLRYTLLSLDTALRENSHRLLRSDALAGGHIALLTGAAGTGKTHLLCDVSRQRVASGRPTILLMGQRFTSDQQPWVQALQQLDMIGLTAEEFVGALEAAAQAARARALIVVDAVNEGNGRNIWPNELPAFLAHVERSPWIAVLLSVRSSYEQIVIPENVRSRAVPLVHHGFADHEYDATKTFFVHYGLELPSTPLLAPEFANPLFLKTLCQGLNASGQRRLPRGFRGMSAVFGLYLDAINDRMASALGFNPKSALVTRALSAFANELVTVGKQWLPLVKAEEVVNALLPGREFERSMYRSLVVEGILVEEMVSGQDERQEEVVFIGYERLADHLIAKTLLEAYVDKAAPEGAFAAGAPLSFFWDCSRYVSPGLIEAMCVQVPEHVGREFPSLVPRLSHWRIGDALRQSIVWRSPEAFSEETRDQLNAAIRSDHDWQQTLDVLLTVATLPGHPFNAYRLDELLRPEKMPDRDEKWSIYIHQARGNHTAVDRLVDWAWAQSPTSNLDEEAVDLCAIALAWMLTTSNRFLRDRATKALVVLLTGRLTAVVRLVERFIDVDDPYVVERVLAVSYGTVMRSHSPPEVGAVADCVYQRIFASGAPPAQILTRDYARGVVERALYLGSAIEVDEKLIRPPYNSTWPNIPSEEEIKPYLPKWPSDAPDKGRPLWARNRIGSSVLDDDFARYVIGTNSGMTNWLSLRLGEPRWRSAEELTEELLAEFSGEEAEAWERYELANKAVLFAPLERFLPTRGEGAQSENTDATSDEELKQTEGETTREQEYTTALAALRSVVAAERAERLDTLIQAEAEHRRPPYFDLRLFQRYILWRVFDLGWTTERFGEFDRVFVGQSGREAHKAERIGKKYQWIAFHEILAFVSDHFQYLGEFRGPGDTNYWGPWQDWLRDIDPSCTLRSTPGGTSWSGHAPAWWEPISYNNWDTSTEPGEWALDTRDFPDLAKLLSVANPADGSLWLNAQAYFHWDQPTPADRERSDTEQRQIWAIVTGYLIRNKDADAFMAWAKGVSFWGRWMSEPAEIYKMYLGEHPWAPAARYFEQAYYGERGWHQPGHECPVEVRVAALEYMCEGNVLDCSLDDGFALRLPVPDLIAGLGLHWSGDAGDYIDGGANLCAFDPTAHDIGPSSFLIRQDRLVEFMKREGLTICWAVLAEKRVIGPSLGSRAYPSLEVSGAFVLTAEGPRGSLNFEDARSLRE
jgi:hypothetical protein